MFFGGAEKHHERILPDIAVGWKCSIFFRVKLEASRVERVNNFFAGHGNYPLVITGNAAMKAHLRCMYHIYILEKVEISPAGHKILYLSQQIHL